MAKLRYFLEGMASLSIFENLPSYELDDIYSNENLTPQQKDAIALKSDWEKAGQDIKKATEDFYKENIENKL